MSDLKNWNLSEIGMIFDPQTGESFQLNSSAYFIMELMKQGQSNHQIASAMVERFQIDYQQAITDLLAFEVEIDIIKRTVA